jgi:hypothetical protein
MKIIELDLLFQIWRYELSKLHDLSYYDIKILYEYFNKGFSPKETFYLIIYLPF